MQIEIKTEINSIMLYAKQTGSNNDIIALFDYKLFFF